MAGPPPTSDGPAIRAGSAHDTLGCLEGYATGAREAVLERMRPDRRQAFLEFGRTGWIPADLDGEFQAALVAQFDYDGAVAFARFALRSHVEGPLLKPIVNGAMRLFGVTPSGLLRMLPRAWPAVYRNVAQPRYEAVGDHELRLVFERFDPAMLRHAGYRASIEGSLRGVLDVCGVQGHVWCEPDLTIGTLTARVWWTPRTSN